MGNSFQEKQMGNSFQEKQLTINQKQFVKGLIAKKPRDNAPEWVKCNLSIKREDLASWLAGQTGDWINVNVCESRNGKWYAEVDTWKPKNE